MSNDEQSSSSTSTSPSLSNQQRKENIRKALRKVRDAQGGTTGGVTGSAGVKGFSSGSGGTGGTKIIVDESGRSAIVPESLNVQNSQQLSFQQKIQKRIFEGQGLSVKVDKGGNLVTSKKGTSRILITRGGNITRLTPNDKVSTNKKGVVTINRGSRKKVISSSGKSVTVPASAKVDTKRLEQTVREKKLKKIQKEVEFIDLRTVPVKDKKLIKKILRGELSISASEAGLRAIIAGKKDTRSRVTKAKEKFISTATKKREEAKDVKAYIEQKKRLGQKITKEDRLALAVSGVGSLGALAVRGFGTPILMPVRTVKGFGKILTTNPVTTINQIIKAFTSDPIGVAVETYAAGKAFQAIGRAGGAVLRPLAKTRLIKGVNANALRIANGMKRAAKKVPGAKKAASIVKAADKLKNAVKNKIVQNKVLSKLSKKGKPQKGLASELIRKIEINKKSITRLLKEKKQIAKNLKKSGAKLNFKNINKKITTLKNANRQFNKQLLKTKVSPGKRAILRRAVKKDIKGIVKKSKIPKAKAKVSVRLEVSKSISKPTKKIIADTSTVLKKTGYTIKKISGRAIKPLTKAAKRTLIRAKIIISAAKKVTLRQLNKINNTLKPFGYKVQKYVRAAKKLHKVRKALTKSRATHLTSKIKRPIIRGTTSVQKYFRQVKELRAIRKALTRSRAVRATNIIKDTINIYLKKGISSLDKALRKTLSKINKYSPVKIKIKLITKDGTIHSWYKGRRTIIKNNKIGAGQARRIRRAGSRSSKKLSNKQITDLARKVRQGKINLRNLSTSVRKRVRRELVKGKKATTLNEIAIRRSKENLFNQFQSNNGKIVQKIQNSKPKKGSISKSNKKANDSFKQTKQKEVEIKTADGQILIQKVKQSAKKVKGVKQKGKTGAKQYTNAKESLVKTQEAIGKLAGNKRINLGFLKAATKTVLALSVVLNNRADALKILQRQKLRSTTKAGTKAGTKTGTKPSTKQTQRPKTVQKPKEVQKIKEIQVPIIGSRVDTQSGSRQIQIINNILAPLALASAFRLRGKTVTKAQTRLRGGVAKARKYIYNRLQKKQRAFTPDIYSLIFGIKARPGEKISLLRKGRVFTGIERRSQVK